MSVTISLPPEAEAKLRLRAQAAGEELPEFLAKLISQFAVPPKSLEEISGDIYKSFLASGMTDDELGDMLEKAKQEMRRERRKTSSNYPTFLV